MVNLEHPDLLGETIAASRTDCQRIDRAAASIGTSRSEGSIRAGVWRGG
jgi:hypothetical protein